jgi:ferric-dicitrate binding protein FerR (iron transport regulator)
MSLSGCVVLTCVLLLSDAATAQQANVKCTSANPTNVAQTLQCEGGVTIVAENGAQYTLGDANRDGRIDSVELSSKALLLDVQRKSSGRKFQVNTPQAIAAVRGTRWAVDVAEGKTSVFVVHGSVNVGRRSGADRQVVLGPGEGVDVEASAPLVVKRWAPARVSALMARLGQSGPGQSGPGQSRPGQ